MKTHLQTAVLAAFFLLLLCGAGVGRPALANDLNPLEPADTTSPRSTLQGFLEIMNKRFEDTLGPNGLVTQYMASDRLFPTESEYEQAITMMNRQRGITAKFMDLSALPQASIDQTAWRLTIQLKEILDRIELPPMESVPDAAMMIALNRKKWTVPDSELRIALVESGPHEGEYLFTQDTVRQIPDFYSRIKRQPYRPGGSPGMYDFVFHAPSGVAMALNAIIPPRWLFDIPDVAKVLILDQPLWRWFGIVLVLGLMLGFFWLCIRILRHKRSTTHLHSTLWELLPPASLLLSAPVAYVVMGEVLRVSPNLYEGLTLSLWTVFYLSMTWLVWTTGSVLAEWLIGFERMQSSSTDSQLIRLALRLVSTLLAIAILIEGANRVGLPSYSVIAGLGIGGLAAALAGQQALANLFGSLIIMFEKPFRIGHRIKAEGIEGTVEDIGFRCTRLRTPENTLVSLPSSEVVNHTIENLTLRQYWRVERTLHVGFETPVAALRGFEADLYRSLQQRSDVRQDTLRVALTDIGLHGYEIRVDFSVRAGDETEHLQQCDGIFLAFAEAAEQHQISFQRAE